MSSMLSAPAIIPATRQGTFTCAFTPHGRPIRTCSPARSAQARPLRQGHHRDQARLRHEMRVIKRRVDLRQLMQQSHLRGVLSSSTTVASATPIVPAQRAPFASTRPNEHLFTRWIEAYNAILVQQVFSALCAKNAKLATMLAARLEINSRNRGIVSWLNAIVAHVMEDSAAAQRYLEECLQRPLSVEERADKLAWIHVWKATISPGPGPRIAFYFPRLPAVLTGLTVDIIASSIDEVLP